MKKKTRRYLLLLVCLFLLFILCQQTTSKEIEEYEVTGITVYRVYPFRPTEEYGFKTIFFKNYSYKNFSIDCPWSTPFSFDSSKKQMILENIGINSLVTPSSITIYSRNGTSSQNEYITFNFKDKLNYRCIIFPTMVIGIGELTETNEYISISEMNNRRRDFLSFFENFIMDIAQLNINFQQSAFLTDDSLPQESMIWTRIIRITPNFNYLLDEQSIDFLYFRTFKSEKVVTEDRLKMMLSCSISSDYINEVVLFDGYNLEWQKTYYNYPLGANENIIKLRMLTELNYVILPYALEELSKLREGLDYLENKLTQLNEKSPDEIKNSGIFEDLNFYNNNIRKLHHLDIGINLRNTDTLFETIFGPKIEYQYEELSILIDDINTQYYFLKDYYNDLLNSAYIDSTITLQFYAIILAIASMISTIIIPPSWDWYKYNYSTPDFSVHFKRTHKKSFIEPKLQELKLLPNTEELVWVMLHNNGKVITDNWFCNIDFDKGFIPLIIQNTQYNNVDFMKKYTIQMIYNAAQFNSADFSPLFPDDETLIFPVVVKTPSKSGKYTVRVTVFSGNHKNKFIHELSIIIKKPSKKTIIRQFKLLKGIGKVKAELIYKSGFNSMEKLKKASIADLVKIKGIAEKTATDIMNQLKKQNK